MNNVHHQVTLTLHGYNDAGATGDVTIPMTNDQLLFFEAGCTVNILDGWYKVTTRSNERVIKLPDAVKAAVLQTGGAVFMQPVEITVRYTIHLQRIA